MTLQDIADDIDVIRDCMTVDVKRAIRYREVLIKTVVQQIAQDPAKPLPVEFARALLPVFDIQMTPIDP